MEISGVQVQAEADKDSGVLQAFFSRPVIGDGLRRHVEHEQLLGQHLLELFRGDPVSVGGYADFAQVKAFLVPVGQAAAPLFRQAGGGSAGSAEDGFLEFPQAAEGAEARFHAHYGDRRGDGRGGLRRGPAGGGEKGAGVFFHQHMRVYAAETESADGGAPRGLAVAGGPVLAF